jgi:pimeloyl-ACP methyl ester carboxylesterase
MMKTYIKHSIIINTLILLACSSLFLFTNTLAQISDELITEVVSFTNEETKLAGTLIIPSMDGPHPGVVLISGSGPQDRDGASRAIPGYRPFAEIGEYLGHNGFAVLRYDDRGVGKSTGAYIEAEEEDFIKDAEAAVRFLQARKDISAEAVGILGHSEGALIAANVASNNPDVAFVISLAGGAVDGYSLFLRQAELQARALGMTKEQIADVVQEQQTIFDLVLKKDWEELTIVVTAITQKRLKALPEEKKASININEFARKRASQSVLTFQHPRYQYLLGHDFGADWKKVAVPVLALFGELDVQCDPAMNKVAIDQILKKAGNQNITTIEIPSANHLFLKAQTGSMSEYTILPKDFVPGFLEIILDWLNTYKANIDY